MADITATLLTNGASEANTAVYSTASISPGSTKLLLAMVNGLRLAVDLDGAPTCAGLGLTWVEIGTAAYRHGELAPDRTRMSIFAAFGSGSTGAVTFTFPETQARATFSVVEFSNTVQSIDAVIQLVISAQATTSTPSVTLAAFAASENATFGFGGWSLPPNATGVPGTGFTEISDLQVSPEGTGLYAQFRLDNDTSVDLTYSIAVRNVLMGIELGNEFPTPTVIAAADSIDLAVDPEIAVVDVAKAAADTAGLALLDGAVAGITSLAQGDLITIGDFAEFGAAIGFKEIENDPPDAIVATGEAVPAFIEGLAFPSKTLMIAEIKLTGGTLFRAGKGIRHPTRMYVGKVKSFGSIIRSIQVPSGFPQIGDAELTIIDTDGELRRLMSATPPQNREIVIKIGGEGESEAIFQIAYTGIIVHATFPPGLAKIRVSDNTFKFLAEKLPDLLTRENFVADPVFARNIRQRTEGRFDESEIFSPIVFGVLDSTDLDVIGSMNAVRLDSTTFNLAQHPIPHGPIRIFVKDPDAKPNPDQSFIEQVGGFSIIEVAKTIEGIDYIFTHVVFGIGQADGFEVRWDGEGMTDDDTKDGTVIRNPAEAIKQYLIRIARRDPTEIDLIGFDSAGAVMGAVATGGPSPGFFCDGAITQRMTHREALARMTRSFGIFLFTNKDGAITIRYIGDSNPDRTILDDVQDIYVRTETHMLARPIVNEVDLQYIRMFSEQSWQGILTVSDDDAIESLERVESKDLKLFFVRDDFVADRVARDFLQFTSPGSFRIVMTIPGHRRTGDVELGELIGVTNYSGLDPSGAGYENKEFLIQKTQFRTDSKELRVFAVARAEPPSFGLSESTSLEFIDIEAASGLFENGLWKEMTGRPPLDAGFANPVVLPFKPKWVTIEVGNAFGGFPAIPVPTIAELDFGKGPPGNIEVVLDGITIITDQTGVDANTSRMYSFPYEGWKNGDRLWVRARDNLDLVSPKHFWRTDITLWR